MKRMFYLAALSVAMHLTAALRPRASPEFLFATRPTSPLRLNANIAIGEDPPTEFLIWTYGTVETIYGPFQFTTRSGQLCMAFVEERGNDLFFDYDHAFWADAGAPDKGKAAGWFKLELRADGLWATGITWTPAAAQAIRDKEWRYFSPALDADPKTGEITRLWNIALTNLPATHNQTPLVAAKVSLEQSGFEDGDVVNVLGEPHMPGQSKGTVREALLTWVYGIEFEGMEDMGVHRWYTEEELQAADPEQTSAKKKKRKGHMPGMKMAALDHRTPDVQASVSLDNLYRLLDQALCERHRDAWVVEIFNDYVVFQYSGVLWSIAYTVSGTVVTLSADATEVTRQYIPVQGGQTMRTLLTALGLAVTATEAEALQTLNSRTAATETLQRQLLSATGQTDVQAALGVVAANAQAAVQLSAAQVRVDELEKEQRTIKLSALITKGRTERKLTPALETWAATQTVEALGAYLEHAPVITQLDPAASPATPPANNPQELGDQGNLPVTLNGKTWEQMEPADKHNLYVDDKPTYDALRADHLKRNGK